MIEQTAQGYPEERALDGCSSELKEMINGGISVLAISLRAKEQKSQRTGVSSG